MSKNKNIPEISWGNGYVVDSEIQNRIVGNILGIIELAGLTEKQEESAKGLIRKAVWDCFEHSAHISARANTAIKELQFSKRKEANTSNLPMSELDFTIVPA